MSEPRKASGSEADEAAHAEVGNAPEADGHTPEHGAARPEPPRRATAGGEVRRLDRAPGERYQQRVAVVPSRGATRARRLSFAILAALGTAVVTFALITVDIGPGLLVLGLAGGWLTGLAMAGGARSGSGDDAGAARAATAAILAAAGVALGLLLDALRAYALGGVLLPWEYAIARFGWLAPAAIVLGAAAGALRGR